MNETRFPTGDWHKSSYSGNSGDCVEVAAAPAAVGVRDTKDRSGGALTVSARGWAHFTGNGHGVRESGDE